MPKKIFCIVSFLILTFNFVACSVPVDYSQVRVVKVIDGDTVRLSDGRLLRYIGIDTPEIRVKKNKKFVYDPQPFSLEAKEYNRKLVEGKTVRIEFDVEKQDRYNRLLGYCFVDDLFVNAKLIEEGFAVLYTFPPNVKYVDKFVTLQKKSRHARKGLWGSYEVIDHQVADRYINQIRSVRGEVLSTYRSDKCIYLNFGSNYKTDFTVVIFKNSFDNFSSVGIDPVSFYRRKIIEVTGRIKEYNGPEIIVSMPQEITIIEELNE